MPIANSANITRYPSGVAISTAWFKKNSTPGERNDHGAWNGQNLLGLDPLDEMHTPEGRPIMIANNGRVMKELL